MDYQIYQNHIQRQRDLLRERENDRLAKEAAKANSRAIVHRGWSLSQIVRLWGVLRQWAAQKAGPMQDCSLEPSLKSKVAVEADSAG